ncbi:Uncharacterized protein Fot_43352 [Forsythia ovata]|uniref:Uncharacterized protein n=1 Tax=Forsythia ovata TaxID=205694 RepID=A0ABD1RNU7_9LAMI
MLTSEGVFFQFRIRSRLQSTNRVSRDQVDIKTSGFGGVTDGASMDGRLANKYRGRDACTTKVTRMTHLSHNPYKICFSCCYYNCSSSTLYCPQYYQYKYTRHCNRCRVHWVSSTILMCDARFVRNCCCSMIERHPPMPL